MRRKVTYFYDSDIGSYYYGPGHPMKPVRVAMAHDLVTSYGLSSNPRLRVCKSMPVAPRDLCDFHTTDYVRYLQQTVDMERIDMNAKTYNIGIEFDCPLFKGLFDMSLHAAGASVAAARQIISSQADVAINWGGGFHHAKRANASGFCYINDAVLAILELLRYYPRVLYIDIDVHHGDGVEEASDCEG